MAHPHLNPDPREREIFLEALDRESPEARKAFLDGACLDQASLRAKVEAMLADHFAEDRFMAAPVAGEAPLRPSENLVIEQPGDRIGRYKLLEKIGEGGCGVVYMAEQEEPVRRRVALKIIKLGLETKSVIARFEAERQALAMMDHPNIAKIHDGGVTGEESRAGVPPAPAASAAEGNADAPNADAPSARGRRDAPPTLGRPYFVMEQVRGVRITD
jgi:hypothetical protein